MASKLLMLVALLIGFTANASFSENSRRYVTVKDIFGMWSQKFPVLAQLKDNPKLLSLQCYAINDNNINVTGVVNPAIGQPSVNLPPPGFVRWYGSCANSVVNIQFKDLPQQPTNDKLWARFWPKQVLDKLRDDSNDSAPYHAFADTKWGDLSPDLRASIIRFAIEEMIGPEPVLKDLGFVKSMDELVRAVGSTVDAKTGSVTSVTEKVYLATLLREEFLTY